MMTAATAGEPTALGFVESGRQVLGFMYPGFGGFAVADVDGDGISDFVVSAGSGGPAFLVIGRLDDGSIGLKQARFLPDEASIARVLSTSDGAGTHVYAVEDSGIVRDFAGWPLQEVRAIPIAQGATAAVVGDLFGNGGSELVVLTPDHMLAYGLTNGAQLWSIANPGASDLVLAQLDGDPALEMVLGSVPGLVLDGATLATDWQYTDSFTPPLAAGHLLGDSSTQFLTTISFTDFMVFGGSPWGVLWSGGNASGGISALTTAKLDNSGRDVILEGDAQFGAVHAIDAGTHQERFQIPDPGLGVTAIASADVDGDAIPEIALSDTPFLGVAAEVVDSRSGAVKWSFVPQGSDFSAVALGDVDGDGQQDLVVAGNAGGTSGVIEIYDAATGALKWQSPQAGNANDGFYISTSRVLLSPHATDAGQDIVLAGTSVYDGRITVFDGITHAIRLQIGTYFQGPMPSRDLVDAALVDFDGDGVLDIVAATSGNVSAQLQVFSGADGHALWTTPADISPIVSVLLTGSAAEPSSELIAVLPGGLRAYNIQTQSLDWSLMVAADGATYIPVGVDGPEIAVFEHSGTVAFYDRSTRALLRSFTLQSPLNAVLPLDGNVRKLLVADGQALSLVDGNSGSVLARTEFLGTGLGSGNRLAATYQGASVWRVASGNAFGVFRHEIRMVPDTIFSNDFEAVP